MKRNGMKGLSGISPGKVGNAVPAERRRPLSASATRSRPAPLVPLQVPAHTLQAHLVPVQRIPFVMLGICAPLRTRSAVWALRQTTARPPQRLPCRVAFAQRLLATHAAQPPPVTTNGSPSGSRSASTAQSQSDLPSNKPDTPPPLPTGPAAPKPSVLSRVLPASLAEKGKTASSFRKIVALAKPETKPLTISIGLLVVSSAVSMSIPFTVGRLIDFFTTPTPVSHQVCSILLYAQCALG